MEEIQCSLKRHRYALYLCISSRKYQSPISHYLNPLDSENHYKINRQLDARDVSRGFHQLEVVALNSDWVMS